MGKVCFNFCNYIEIAGLKISWTGASAIGNFSESEILLDEI